MSSDEDVLARALSAIDETGDPSSAMHRLPWAEYSSTSDVFDNLLDIKGFALLLDLSPLPELADRQVSSQIATAMYGIVLSAIQEAEFFQEDALSVRSDAGSATVVYGDDRYD